MFDKHDPKTRSYNMSRIRSKDTRPEILVRKYLHNNGFRYRLHVKSLPGNPDIVLKKYKTVIFVNGCFWHGHEGCEDFILPKSNREYWIPKIQKNMKNDLNNKEKLVRMKWNVFVIWECQLKKNNVEENLIKLTETIREKRIKKQSC